MLRVAGLTFVSTHFFILSIKIFYFISQHLVVDQVTFSKM